MPGKASGAQGARGAAGKAGALLDPLLTAGADPLTYLVQGRGAGARPAVGYVCSYVPEEIILAAGYHPVRLGGSLGPTGPADGCLQSFACSFARALLDALVEDLAPAANPRLAGVVFAYTCDSLRAVYELWRGRAPRGTFVHFLNLPARVEGRGVLEYATLEARSLAETLAAHSGGRLPAAEAFAQASAVLQSVRLQLQRLARVRSDRPDLLPGSVHLAAARGAAVSDRQEAAEVLEAAADELEREAAAEGQPGASPQRPRILVSGGFLETEEPLRLIEEAGADIVADDLCLGARWYGGLRRPIAGEDPFVAAARTGLERVPCATKHPPTRRFDFVAGEAAAHRVDGVVFLLQKFCDPHAFDYPDLRQRLQGLGRPCLLVDVEQGRVAAGPGRTRLEAFVERLRSGPGRPRLGPPGPLGPPEPGPGREGGGDAR